jgi:hypothetical protein
MGIGSEKGLIGKFLNIKVGRGRRGVHVLGKSSFSSLI